MNIEDTELIGKMFQAAKNMAIKLGIDKSGYRTIFNCNEDGGQTVYHIHLHLIGGRSLDGLQDKKMHISKLEIFGFKSFAKKKLFYSILELQE